MCSCAYCHFYHAFISQQGLIMTIENQLTIVILCVFSVKQKNLCKFNIENPKSKIQNPNPIKAQKWASILGMGISVISHPSHSNTMPRQLTVKYMGPIFRYFPKARRVFCVGKVPPRPLLSPRLLSYEIFSSPLFLDPTFFFFFGVYSIAQDPPPP